MNRELLRVTLTFEEPLTLSPLPGVPGRGDRTCPQSLAVRFGSGNRHSSTILWVVWWNDIVKQGAVNTRWRVQRRLALLVPERTSSGISLRNPLE